MKADAYADSSFIVSLLRIDANHEAAMRYMAKSGETLAFNPLQRVEVRNALRNAQAFGQITASEQRSAFRQIEQDLQAGLGGTCRRVGVSAYRRAHVVASYTDASFRAVVPRTPIMASPASLASE